MIGAASILRPMLGCGFADLLMKHAYIIDGMSYLKVENGKVKQD